MSRPKMPAASEDADTEETRGLWALPEAQRVPPWEWRTARREEHRR